MPRPRRLALWGAALVALVAAGAVGALLVERKALAAHWIESQLGARGIAPVSLDVTRVDTRGVALDSLVIGPPDAPTLRIAHAEADWSLRGLLEQRLDAVRIDGAHLRAALTGTGLDVGALDPLLTAPAAQAGPALPLRALALRDGTVALDTPRGPATGTLAGSAEQTSAGAIAGSFTLSLAGAGLAASGTLALGGTLDEPSFRARFEPTGIPQLSGQLEAVGRVVQADGARRFEGEVALRDVAWKGAAIAATGVNGAIRLAAPPLHTPRGQMISIARVDAGIPLDDGIVTFQLRPDGRIAVTRAALSFADGTIETDDALLDPRAEDNALVLRARALDLDALFQRVALPGLSGSGRIGGTLPLERKGTELLVHEGVLSAGPAGGTIRYVPSDEVRALAASRPNDLGLAVQALSDFHFDQLTAHLDGNLDGAMTVALHVHGVNPSFQHGRPVELNLNLEAHIADLVRAGVASYRVPEVIEEQLRSFSERLGTPPEGEPGAARPAAADSHAGGPPAAQPGAEPGGRTQ